MLDIARTILEAVNNARTPGDVSAAIASLEWHTNDDACAILTQYVASGWWIANDNWPDETAWSKAMEAAAYEACGVKADPTMLAQVLRDEPKDFAIFLTSTTRVQDPLFGKQYLPSDKGDNDEWQRRAELGERKGGDWGLLIAGLHELPLNDFARNYFQYFFRKKAGVAAHLFGLIDLGDFPGAVIFLARNLPLRHPGGFGIPFFNNGGKKIKTLEKSRERLLAAFSVRRQQSIDEYF